MNKGAHSLSFPLLAALALVIYARKVANDDRNGQRDDQHSTQRTDTTEHLSQDLHGLVLELMNTSLEKDCFLEVYINPKLYPKSLKVLV